MEDRMDVGALQPGAYRAMVRLDGAIQNVGLPGPLVDLIKLRASQLNGCAYCVDLHSFDAKAGGETDERLYAVAAWRETPFFDDRERAALALTESMTRLTDDRDRVPDQQALGRHPEALRRQGAGRPGHGHHDDQRMEPPRRDPPHGSRVLQARACVISCESSAEVESCQTCWSVTSPTRYWPPSTPTHSGWACHGREYVRDALSRPSAASPSATAVTRSPTSPVRGALRRSRRRRGRCVRPGSDRAVADRQVRTDPARPRVPTPADGLTGSSAGSCAISHGDLLEVGLLRPLSVRAPRSALDSPPLRRCRSST